MLCTIHHWLIKPLSLSQVSGVTCHLSPVTCHLSTVNCHLSTVTCHHKGFFWPPVPAKPNILYSRGKFVDIVCWTVDCVTTTLTEQETKSERLCLSPVTCHLSPVTFHMSSVTCHLSPVTIKQWDQATELITIRLFTKVHSLGLCEGISLGVVLGLSYSHEGIIPRSQCWQGGIIESMGSFARVYGILWQNMCRPAPPPPSSSLQPLGFNWKSSQTRWQALFWGVKV